MIVVDTNVTSELMRPSPSPAVIGWVRSHGDTELFTTSITVAELRYGIERLPEGRRQELLRSAAEEIFSAFANHVLAFDVAAAKEYARVVTHRERAGRPMNGFDAQIASICRVHDAILATRSVKDYEGTDLRVVDPWHST